MKIFYSESVKLTKLKAKPGYFAKFYQFSYLLLEVRIFDKIRQAIVPSVVVGTVAKYLE